MIACPRCGKETAVKETRATRGGAKRRRHCTDRQCSGRCTTLEMVVAGESGLEAQIAGTWALVRVDKLESALGLVSAALGMHARSVDLGRWDPGGVAVAAETQRTARLSRIEPKVCEPAFLADLLPDPRSDSGE